MSRAARHQGPLGCMHYQPPPPKEVGKAFAKRETFEWKANVLRSFLPKGRVQDARNAGKKTEL